MKSIRYRLLMAAMAVLLGTAVARSQTTTDAPAAPPMHGHHGYSMQGHRMGFLAKQLNLTDDQKAQMKAIMQKEHPGMKPLFQQEHQIDQQLRAFVEGPYDEGKVRSLATQKAQLAVERTVAETRIHNQMYQVLTADQQAKLKELEANHEARMQQHMKQAPAAAPEQ